MRLVPCLLIALAVLVLVPSCGEPGEELKNVGDKLGETWDAVKAYGVKKRQAFESWSSQALDDLDGQLDEAKRKAARAGDAAGKVIDEQWAVAQEKLEALKVAGADGWEKAKEEFVEATDALRRTIDGGS